MQKTALVLSAGGSFGAYQVGAWKALERTFQPDIVVGTSIGSLHAWCIAGGASASDLEAMWLDQSRAPEFRFRLPRSWRHGVLDTRRMEGQIRELHERFRPRCSIGIVCTSVRGLRQRLFQDDEITWRHLAGSCAIPGALRLRRLDGVTYADGGLFDSLNVWAAVEMGATRIVAINAWRPRRLALIDAPLGWLAHRRRRRVEENGATGPAGPPISWELIEPDHELGSLADALRWTPARVRHWLDLGEEDATRKKQKLCAMF